jgi:O-antigen ligase
MKPRPTRRSTAAPPARNPVRRYLWWTIAAIVIATPLIYVPQATELFRFPKNLYFRAGSIALAALLVIGAIREGIRIDREELKKMPVVLGLAIAAWTALTTIISTNAALSVRALAIALAYLLFFFTARSLLRDRPMTALRLVMIPALINGVLVMLQEAGWQPLQLEELWDRHLASTALMGNPNDVGTVLMGPTLASLAAAIVLRGGKRVLAGVVALVLAAAVVSSQTLTAVIALVVGAALMMIVASWKRAVIALGVLGVVLLVLFTAYEPLARRATRLRGLAARGEYNMLLTNRLTPFAAAWEMFRARPLAGQGPGTFAWHYFDFKVGVDRKYPTLMTDVQRASWSYNFSEVHNDHLEILAESGLPGYVLYLASLAGLASISFRRRDGPEGERRRFARLFALPFAAAFATLTLAQFPLQLAATAVTCLFLAAICVAWSEIDEPS